MRNRFVMSRGLVAAVAALTIFSSCSKNSDTGTAPPNLPPAPTGVTASPLWGQVTVSWDFNAGAVTNNVYWSTTAGVTPQTGTKVTAADNPFVQTGLTNGTTYYYVVTATNVNGESAPSAEVSATPATTEKPAMPLGVKAVPGNASDTIRWNVDPGTTSYNLYWSNTPGIDVTDATTYAFKISNPTSSYVHALLTNGTTYYYVVTGVNANGESDPSAEVSATPQAPLAPPTLSSVHAGNAKDTLKWTSVAGASTYNVYRGTAPGVTTLTGTKLASHTSPFTDSVGLTNGTTYYYVVTAVKGGVEGAISNELSATPQAPPAAPSGVTGAITSATSVTITWPAVSGATGYNIYYSTSQNVSVSTGTKVGGVTSPSTVTGLTTGTPYFFIVTATALGVESPASSPAVSVTPNALPAAPGGVTAMPGSASDTVAWTAVANATSYNIYWSTTTGVTTGTGTKISGVTNPFAHSPLTNGTAYFYIVTAVNSAGEGPASSQVTATPKAALAAPVVTAVLGDTHNTITWPAVAGAAGYNLYWSTSPGVTVATGTEIKGVVSPEAHTGLTNGTTYYYIVVDTVVSPSTSNHGVSSPASVEVSATPLTAPGPVTATAGSKQVTVGWTPELGATSYNIYWSTTTGVTTGTGTKITGAANPYVQTGLTSGTPYYYIVTAVNASGESAASPQVTATPTP